MSLLYNKRLIFILLLLRLLVAFFIFYVSRFSSVYTSYRQILVTSASEIYLLGFVLLVKVILGSILEILFTTEFQSLDVGLSELSKPSTKRLNVFYLLVVLSQVLILIDIMIMLNTSGFNIAYILSAADSQSLASLLLDPNTGFLFWGAMAIYSIALIYLVYPRDSDPSSKSAIGSSTLVLFVKNIFLPL